MAIVIVFGALLLALMIAGWRTRRARQQDYAAPPVISEDLGDLVGEFAGKYVATCRGGEPLERIVSHGLGFRGKATISITALGILVDRVGERALWIPFTAMRDVRRATWTIDRVVETDGLHLIEWTLGDRVVDTTLRVDEPTAFDAALTTAGIPERQTP
jgi:hypothetical protein